MKLIIANKKNVNEFMKSLKEPYGVIAVSEPYDDPLLYATQANMFAGMLKLCAFDSDAMNMHDRKLLFSSAMCKAVINFYEAMLCLRVETIIVHCRQGLHRSFSICLGLESVFKEQDIEIINRPVPPEPNLFILEFFKDYQQ